MSQFAEEGVTDVWLPLSRQTTRRLLENIVDANTFEHRQTAIYPDHHMFQGHSSQYLALSDPDLLNVQKLRLLGAGGYGGF